MGKKSRNICSRWENDKKGKLARVIGLWDYGMIPWLGGGGGWTFWKTFLEVIYIYIYI